MTKHHPPLTICTATALLMTTACSDNDNGSDNTERVGANESDVSIDISAHNSGEVYALAVVKDGFPDGDITSLPEGGSLWLSREPITDYEVSDNIVDSLVETRRNVGRMRQGEDIREPGNVLFDYQEDLLDNYYSGVIEGGGNDRYYAGYLGGSSGVDAVNSYVTLPPAFEITAPLPNETVSRANDIAVRWQTSDTEIFLTEVRATTECGQGSENDSTRSGRGGPGFATIYGSSPYGGPLGLQADGNCPLRISVTKTVFGTIDERLGTGRISGSRTATVTISSTD